MTEHRARTLFNLLPIALATGYSEVEPEIELLKVLYLLIQVAETVSDYVLRTWTPTQTLEAKIRRRVSLSLGVTRFRRPMLRLTLLSYEIPGVDTRRGNPYPTLTGHQNLHPTSGDRSTCGSTTSNFGWIQTWSGSKMVMLPSRIYVGDLITWSSK